MTEEITSRTHGKVGDKLAMPVIRHIELVPVNTGALAGITDDQLPPLPVKPFWRRHWLFLGLFAFPVLVATIYFGFIASDIYVAEAKFIVRSASRSDGSGLAMLMQSQGMARAVDETYAVNEFIQSRDAANQLVRDDDLTTVLGRPEADIFARYPNPFLHNTQERLYKAYQRLISLDTDPTTGISSLKVKAFRPEDAERIASALLVKGEEFVNRLNIRANQDSVKFSTELVKEAQLRLNDVEARLATYRNQQMIVDPERESTESIATLGKLSTEIARLEATLAEQSAMAPSNPSLAPLRERVTSYRDQLSKMQSRIVGGTGSIASKLQGFELLTLERELSAKGMAAAVIELEKARQEAQSQRIYLQTIRRPNLPEQPQLPMRLLSILVIAAVSFCIYWIARNLLAATLEHQ